MLERELGSVALTDGDVIANIYSGTATPLDDLVAYRIYRDVAWNALVEIAAEYADGSIPLPEPMDYPTLAEQIAVLLSMPKDHISEHQRNTLETNLRDRLTELSRTPKRRREIIVQSEVVRMVYNQVWLRDEDRLRTQILDRQNQTKPDTIP
jgi:hypothetical protein